MSEQAVYYCRLNKSVDFTPFGDAIAFAGCANEFAWRGFEPGTCRITGCRGEESDDCSYAIIEFTWKAEGWSCGVINFDDYAFGPLLDADMKQVER